MERLAWIEVLNRYGDVNSRHPVFAWPTLVGRSYNCDLILDDPFIAPNHIEISGEGEQGFQVKDMGSINGMTIANLPGKKTDAIITSDDIIRIGRTQLRIRPSHYPVAPETRYSAKPWQRRPTILLASVIAFLAVLLSAALLNYTEAGIGTYVTPMIITIIMVGLWITAWSFGGRLFAGKTNFIPHAVIACLGVTLFLASGMLIDLVSFSFDSSFVSNLSTEVTFFLFVLILYLHLRLISRAKPGWVAGIAGTVAVLVMATSVLIANILDENDLERQSYRSTIGPPFLLFVDGKSPEAFISSMAVLKSRVQE